MNCLNTCGFNTYHMCVFNIGEEGEGGGSEEGKKLLFLIYRKLVLTCFRWFSTV